MSNANSAMTNFEEKIPELEDIDSDDNWTDEETNDENIVADQPVACIFTGNLFPSAKDYFYFLKKEHDFDIWSLVFVDLNLDFFRFVKIINYLRTHYAGGKPPSSENLISSEDIWGDDKYLKPVIQDDPLLQFMIDEDEEESICLVDDSFNEKCSSDETVEVLKKKLKRSENRNQSLEEQLMEANAKMAEMKEFMKDVILKGDVYRPVAACRQSRDGEEEEEEFEDAGYFATYSHHDIHAEMLQDKVRTASYQNAILSNPDTFKDKVVLDVGCGTGILSMFAVKSGAKHVYGIDMSDIAYQAMDIIKENKMDEKITIVKGCVEEVELPVQKVDIIISEWMGYFLLYESMLDSVLFAADKWLDSAGIVLPNRCSIHLVAAHDETLFNAQIQYWDDVYGFQMSCIKTASMKEASIQVVKPQAIISEPVIVKEFTVPAITMKCLNYMTDFKIKFTKPGKCSAIVGYFDIHFKDGLSNPVSFSTGPFSIPTHWKQTIFFLESTLEVKEGDVMEGHIDCRKNPHDPRSLLIYLTFAGKKRMYTVS